MAEPGRARWRGAWADYLGGAPAHPDPIPSGHLAVAGDRLVFLAPGGARLTVPLADLGGLSLSARPSDDPSGGRPIRTTMRVAARHGDATAVLEFAIERRQAAALRMLIERELAGLSLKPLPLVEQLQPPREQAKASAEEAEAPARAHPLSFLGPLLVAAMPTLLLVALAAFLITRP